LIVRVRLMRSAPAPADRGEHAATEKAMERNIQSRLDSEISLSFNNVPLCQAIQDVKQLTGMNIVLDKSAMAAAKVEMQVPISLNVDRIRLRSALKLLLHDVKLTWIIKDGVLLVTTPEVARGPLRSVTYPIGDLVLDDPKVNSDIPVYFGSSPKGAAFASVIDSPSTNSDSKSPAEKRPAQKRKEDLLI